MPLVVRARCSFRGKDAGSVDSSSGKYVVRTRKRYAQVRNALNRSSESRTSFSQSSGLAGAALRSSIRNRMTSSNDTRPVGKCNFENVTPK